MKAAGYVLCARGLDPVRSSGTRAETELFGAEFLGRARAKEDTRKPLASLAAEPQALAGLGDRTHGDDLSSGAHQHGRSAAYLLT